MHIDVSHEDEGCVTRIKDEGIGIDEADQLNILGIGFLTSKSIIEGSSGTLHIESKTGEGSMFITWLQFAE